MPTILQEKCTKCMKCVNDCPSQCIEIDAALIGETCINCGHCVAICPEEAVLPDSGNVSKLKPHGFTHENFKDFTSGIRSCRAYKDTAIPTELLEKLVENMANYPSASNKREIEITIANSSSAIKLLNDQTSETLFTLFKKLSSPFMHFIVKLFMGKKQGKNIKKYYSFFKEKRNLHPDFICHKAAAVMLFHGPISKTSMLKDDAVIWQTYTSIYANSMGLGTCFNGFITNAAERNKNIGRELGIPKNHSIYAALLMGYPKVKYKNEVSREKPSASYR